MLKIQKAKNLKGFHLNPLEIDSSAVSLFLYLAKKSPLQEKVNQAVVGLLNSACCGPHQYVILNSWFFRSGFS